MQNSTGPTRSAGDGLQHRAHAVLLRQRAVLQHLDRAEGLGHLLQGLDERRGIADGSGEAYSQLLNEVLGEEGIQVSQLIIGGKITAGDAEKGPDVLAGHLWDLHIKRDRFRHQVSAD